MPETDPSVPFKALVKQIFALLVVLVRGAWDYFLKVIKMPYTAQQIQDGVADLATANAAMKTALETVDLKLDDIRTKLEAVAAGLTQAQADEIGAAIDAAKAIAQAGATEGAAVVAEATTLAAP